MSSSKKLSLIDFSKMFLCGSAIIFHAEAFAQTAANCSADTSAKSVLAFARDSMKVNDVSACPIEGKAEKMDSFDFLGQKNALERLIKGSVFAKLVLLENYSKLNESEKSIIAAVTPLTSFADEKNENSVSVPKTEKELNDFDAIINKSMYFIPNLQSKDVSAELIADYGYQQACQPGKFKLEEAKGTNTKNTFRLVKSVGIDITIQMKASEVNKDINPEQFNAIENLNQMNADKIILLERTKGNSSKPDAIHVIKNALVYTDFKGGVLVTLYTVALREKANFATRLLLKPASYFGEKSAPDESNETATKTKKYFNKNSK